MGRVMLARTKSVEIGEDDMSVSSLNHGQVCAWYGMKHWTMEMLVASFTPTNRVLCCCGCHCCFH